MPDKQLNYKWCKAPFVINISEYNRQIKNGRDPNQFFCSRSCSAKYGNSFRKSKVITKVCPHCGTSFRSTTHNKAKTFCFRSCASAGSVTEHRRQMAKKIGKENACNLISPAETLKLREAWKYAEIKQHLEEEDLSHEFEYPLGLFVYDLALFDFRLLIEFDGSYHKGITNQNDIDKSKELTAKHNGWQLERVQVEDNTVIKNLMLVKIVTNALIKRKGINT